MLAARSKGCVLGQKHAFFVVFWHEISAWNFGMKFWLEMFQHEIFRIGILSWKNLARIFGLKNVPKFHTERIGLKWPFGGQMYRALKGNHPISYYSTQKNSYDFMGNVFCKVILWRPLAGDLGEAVGSKVDQRSSQPQTFKVEASNRLLLAGRTKGLNRKTTPFPR